MILGYHAIFSTYGFWLPNDPRGSWSDFVGNPKLLGFGRATKTQSRNSVAHDKHNNQMRLDAKLAMKFTAVVFDGIQARSVGQGFAKYTNKSRSPVWACAILPDHVHLTIGHSESKIEYIVNQLKGYATRQLLADEIHPFQHDSPHVSGGRPKSCWARG